MTVGPKVKANAKIPKAAALPAVVWLYAINAIERNVPVPHITTVGTVRLLAKLNGGRFHPNAYLVKHDFHTNR